MDGDVAAASQRLCEILKQLDRIYERYAKSLGMTYTGLYVLHMIFLSQACTQKYLCEQIFLPKQTVNSIVMAFQKQGLVEMVELPEDRRHKAIRLTEKGHAHAQQVLPGIMRAEARSMEQFSKEEQRIFLGLMERYAQAFSSALQS